VLDTSNSEGRPHSSSAETANGRNETELERCDRNLVELLQEVRVVQTGVQVLFGFLLMAPLTARFQYLNGRQHLEYYASFATAGLAAFLLISPTAYHRALFRRGDKEYLVIVANRLTIAGLGAVGVSMGGATMFVSDVVFGLGGGIAAGTVAAATGVALWVMLPLTRRRKVPRRPRLLDSDLPRVEATMSRTPAVTSAEV
jgi:hypothetical protein